jgi:hypothetical protein
MLHDALIWENGRVELRDGLCRRLDETTLRMTYDDMLGGTMVRLRAGGYDLGPYTMLVSTPGLRVRVPLRCRDTCQLEADNTLTDTIELSFVGIRVGHLAMPCDQPTRSAHFLTLRRDSLVL